MTHIPSKVIIGTSEDLKKVKESYDKWAGEDITEKYGVEFLTVEEAKERGVDLQDAMPFSSVDIDDSAKLLIEAQKELSIKREYVKGRGVKISSGSPTKSRSKGTHLMPKKKKRKKRK